MKIWWSDILIYIIYNSGSEENQDKLLNLHDSVVNSRPISLTWEENRLFGLIFLLILINAYLHK